MAKIKEKPTRVPATVKDFDVSVMVKVAFLGMKSIQPFLRGSGKF